MADEPAWSGSVPLTKLRRNQTIVYASAVGGSFTPDCNIGDYLIRLDQPLTINNPINVPSTPGARLCFYFTQVASTGNEGYAVTWDTAYQEGYPRVSLAQYAPTVCNFLLIPGSFVASTGLVWIDELAPAGGQPLLIGQNNPGPGALNMTFQSGWSTGSRPATMYADLANNIVLSGTLNQTAAAGGTICNNLPPGYGSSVSGSLIIMACAIGSSGGIATMGQLFVNGQALVAGATGVARTWYLDGLSYLAGS